MTTTFLLLATLIVASSAENELLKFAIGNRELSVAYYEGFNKMNKDPNFVISPMSMEAAFGMVYAGARGNTAKQLADGLFFPNNPDELNTLFKAALPFLNSNDKVSIELANRLYLQNKFNARKDFVKIAEDVFDAGLEKVNFHDKEKTVNEINGWMEKMSNGKIKKIIEQKDIDETTVLILLNSLYLNAEWQNQFGKAVVEKFYLNKNDFVEVDMMNLKYYFNYYSSEALKADFLEIPFKDERLSMVIVLPQKLDGLEKLEGQLKDIVSEQPFSKKIVDVSLPRFKIETKVDLISDVLLNMGVSEPFGQGADFSGISENSGLHISKAVQKVYLTVSENGTEAAAGTAVEFIVGSTGDEPEAIQFVADHPFLFYIQKRSDNANILLFLGKVTNPNFDYPN